MSMHRFVSFARKSAGLAILLWMAAASERGDAAPVNLNFATLPSAQGWTYSGDLPENTVYAVDGTKLTQTLVGQSDALGQYAFADALDAGMRTTVRMRARVTDYEVFGGSFTLGFRVGAGDGNWYWQFGLTDTAVMVQNSGMVNVDTTVFHDYRLETRPNGMVALYIDDMLEVSGMGSAATIDAVVFGDITRFENVNFEMTEFSITQVVPEPSAGMLVICGCACAIGGRRRGEREGRLPRERR